VWRLLWIGEGRTQQTLRGFFKWLGPRRSVSLKEVCMDMWRPYLNVVRDQAPQAVMAFDRFHLVRHLNHAVDAARRSLVRRRRQKDAKDGAGDAGPGAVFSRAAPGETT